MCIFCLKFYFIHLGIHLAKEINLRTKQKNKKKVLTQN